MLRGRGREGPRERTTRPCSSPPAFASRPSITTLKAPLESGRRNHVRAQAVAREGHDRAREPYQRPDHVELDTEREVYHVAPRDEGRDLGRTDRLDELVVAEERPEARPPRGGERELVVDQ